MATTTTFTRTYLLSTCAITWFGLLLQFIVLMNGAEHRLTAIANYFSYFTILTNLLVAVMTTASQFFPQTTVGIYFSKPAVQAAIALYIFVVGVIYNLVLRQLWAPEGWQLIADILLHTLVPVLFTCYWIFLVKKGFLKWKNPFGWLVYPLVYCLYSLLRGSITAWYPYPFIDVNVLGYRGVFLNVLLLSTGFLILGMILVFVDGYLGKISAKNK